MKAAIRNLFLVLLLAIVAAFWMAGNSVDAAQNKITLTNAGKPTGAAGSGVSKGIEFCFFDSVTRRSLKDITVSVEGPQVKKTALYKSPTGWFPATFINGRYSVVASAAGYQTYSFTFDTTPLKQWSRLEVTLDPKPPDGKGVLSVYVGDEIKKTPVVGASVTIKGPGGAKTAVISGGGQNTAVFQNLLSGAYSISVVSPSGYQAVNGSANVESPKSVAVNLWAKPTGGYAVKVKVNSPLERKPVSGASVTVSGASDTATAKTGSDGTATLTAPGGKKTITVRAAGYREMKLANVTVPFSETLAINLSRLAYLNVMVTNQSGKALSGAYVVVKNVSPGGESPTPKATDGKGNVSFEVAYGQYSVSVSLKGYKDGRVGNVPSNQLVTVKLSQ